MICPHCLDQVRPGEICQGCGYKPSERVKDWRNPFPNKLEDVIDKLMIRYEVVDILGVIADACEATGTERGRTYARKIESLIEELD